MKLWNLGNCKEKATIKVNKDGISSLTFSPDGNLLAVGAFSDKTLTLWDVATGKEKLTFEMGRHYQ